VRAKVKARIKLETGLKWCCFAGEVCRRPFGDPEQA